jgi:hypothetical protein
VGIMTDSPILGSERRSDGISFFGLISTIARSTP